MWMLFWEIRLKFVSHSDFSNLICDFKIPNDSSKSMPNRFVLMKIVIGSICILFEIKQISKKLLIYTRAAHC